jgi:hypothetical protein
MTFSFFLFYLFSLLLFHFLSYTKTTISPNHASIATQITTKHLAIAIQQL